MTKLSITNEDAIKLIREHYQLPNSVEIEITGQQSNKEADGGWQDVPSDWVHTEPPEVVSRSEYADVVDVLFRSGYVSHRRAPKHIDWSQEGLSYDVIKFRKVR